MNQSTDMVIVGGGVIGCAIAYFLCKAGVEVMVMEQEEIASGTVRVGLPLPIRRKRIDR